MIIYTFLIKAITMIYKEYTKHFIDLGIFCIKYKYKKILKVAFIIKLTKKFCSRNVFTRYIMLNMFKLISKSIKFNIVFSAQI